MVDIKTYQDLLAARNDQERIDFVFTAIENHKASARYKTAVDADLYAHGKNATISQYQKVLYTITGKAVPDNYTANHKCKSGFFKRFITQEAAFEVGNGVTFQKDETKDKLGKNIDTALYRAVKSALSQSVSYGFFNLDHLEFFKLTEFVPLEDEKTSALMAGIRFWQVDSNKPMMAILFELDGYTEFLKDKDGNKKIVNEKKSYKTTEKYTVDENGFEVLEDVVDGGNYPGFPIIPLWANMDHQSELEGHREQIDCYDLIKSGFANDLDDASMIYWTLKNCGGMDDVDLAQFIERMKVLRASNIPGSDEGEAEAHTLEVPYQSRSAYLEILEKDLYKDFMALDVDRIAAGAINIPQLQAAYEPLNEKADELEMCLCEFFSNVFAVAGIDDEPSFERSMISNQMELTTMVLSAAEYLDDETILRKLPFLTADEIEGILERKDAEESDRYRQNEEGEE